MGWFNNGKMKEELDGLRLSFRNHTEEIAALKKEVVELETWVKVLRLHKNDTEDKMQLITENLENFNDSFKINEAFMSDLFDYVVKLRQKHFPQKLNVEWKDQYREDETQEKIENPDENQEEKPLD